MTDLDAAIADLQAAADRLRAGEVDGEQAAGLVEECARIAAAVGSELDRQARAAAAEPVPGQETLL